jgi:hypothetical protein
VAEQERRAADAELERDAAEQDRRRAAELELERAAAEDAEQVTEPEPQTALVSESAGTSELPIYRWFDGT